MDRARLPIGIFDSGLGGLTVVRAITRILPGEDIIYLGDTARVPYGTRSPETVRRYASEGARFLLGKGVKMLVVACNTVSAVGLDAVEAEGNVPVLGVIAPGARAAVKRSGGGKIGVIGTAATVRSGAYLEAIRREAPEAEVLSQPCPLFVPLAEEGWLSGQVPGLVAEEYLKDMKARGVGALVLGCTHYPLLKQVIGNCMGSGVSLIDSAEETAVEVKAKLEELGMRNPAERGGLKMFYVTDSPAKFAEVGGRFLGETMEAVSKVVL